MAEDNKDKEPGHKNPISSHKITSHSEIFGGGIKARVAARKEKLPEIMKNVDKALKDYKGDSLVLAFNMSDENGNLRGSQVLVTGIDGGFEELDLAKHIEECGVKALVKSGQDTLTHGNSQDGGLGSLIDSVLSHRGHNKDSKGKE